MFRTIYSTGFWCALAAGISTIAYVCVQLMQVLSLFHFPADEILIYSSSLCIAFPFLLMMIALHYSVQPHRKFWTHIALCCTILYVFFVVANYVVQLATVIPMKRKGLISEVHILEQTPHSMFWNFDALGYILMGLAAAFASLAFENQGFHKKVKFAMIFHALTTPLISIVYFAPNYNNSLLLLGYPWAVQPRCLCCFSHHGFTN